MRKQPSSARKRSASAKTKPAPTTAAAFAGFGKPTLAFLHALEAHNDKPWFDAHRSDYEQHFLAPAIAFAAALGHAHPSRRALFERQVAVQAAPRSVVLGRRAQGLNASGFFFRLTPTQIVLGTGMHHFEPDQLARYRRAVLDARKGKALAAVIEVRRFLRRAYRALLPLHGWLVREIAGSAQNP